MANGHELERSLRGKVGAIPWMAILDADGRPLVTSDSPDGNIGYPSTVEEIAHFISMIRQTRQRTSDEQIMALQQALEENSLRFRQTTDNH